MCSGLFAAAPQNGGFFMFKSKNSRVIVMAGMFSALSFILYLIEFPIIPGLDYLKIDLSDFPAAAAGILLGPGAGLAVELVKNLLHLLFKGLGSTMGFGDLINFIVGIALVLPLSVIWRGFTAKGRGYIFTALTAGIAALAAMAAAGVIGNYLIAPPYFRAVLHFTLSSAALWSAIGAATVLNIIKSVVTAILTALFVKSAGRLLSRQKA